MSDRKAKVARLAAILSAQARVAGKEAARAMLIDGLRSDDDSLVLALALVVADMMDPDVDTSLGAKEETSLGADIIQGWTDHGNHARDIEIAARVEMELRAGKNQKQAFHAAGVSFGISDSRAARLWRQHRVKLCADEAWLLNC